MVIDSSFGLFNQIGSVNFKEGGIIPAFLSGGKIKKIGDLSITGVTLDNSFFNKLLLKQTKQQMVSKMADFVAIAVNKAYSKSFNNKLL